MSYIVTARKWRPQLFSEVISQKHVTVTLQNAIKSNRVGHAYLFSGPRGVGKTTVARIFAKALNCEHGPSEEPCNECSNCSSIQYGNSMDVQELDGASHNSVEDVRNLISHVGYHASNCRYKMYIVDEVHMLSTPAFNALLKTLEEPPANVIFVFATTEPHKIPATILSRCQRFDFHRLSIQDITSKLHTIAGTDGISIDEGSIVLIAQRAGGAMRDAESILEQLKSSRGGMITVDDVNEVLGIADREVFFSIVERCHEKDSFGAIGIFRKYYDEGGDLKEFVESLLSHLRDLLYAQYENGLEHVMLAEEMKSVVKEQSEWFDRSDLIRMINIVTDVETSLGYAVLPVLRIEMALARLAAMETTVQLRDLFERLGGEIEHAAPGTHKAVQVSGSGKDAGKSTVSESVMYGEKGTYTSPEIMADTADLSKEDRTDKAHVTEDTGDHLYISPDIQSIAASWKEIVDRIGKQKAYAVSSLTPAVPESFENGKLTLVYQPGDTFHCKSVESYSDAIEDMISALLGTKVTITCVIQKENSESIKRTGTEKKNEIDDLISREPIIKDILERFDGEINDTWRE